MNINIKETESIFKSKQFICRICPLLKFLDEKEYLVHIQDVHNGVIHGEMCNLCGKTFQKRSQLATHVKSKCGTEKCFACQECGKQLMSAGSLHNHMKTHRKEANLMCKFCAKLFRFSGQLKIHEKTHTKEKDFICEECGKCFSYRQSLITHASLHSGVKPYQCESCGKAFSCIGNLLKHRTTFRNTCGTFPLTSHRVQNASTKMNILRNTPQSSKLKRLEIKKKLQTQIKSLEVLKEKECGNKDKVTEEKLNMTNLLVNHTQQTLVSNVEVSTKYNAVEDEQEKQNETVPKDEHHSDSVKKKTSKDYLYICEKCGLVFKLKYLLESHTLSNCGEIPRHHCNICDSTFSSKYTLRAHLRIHTSEKDFICKFCNKRFLWKGQLKIHERGHTGEKPFACLFCPSTFAYRESLITHSSQHTGNKPYVCKSCGWRFSCVGNLKKHKATHFDSCGLWYRKYERRQQKII